MIDNQSLLLRGTEEALFLIPGVQRSAFGIGKVSNDVKSGQFMDDNGIREGDEQVLGRHDGHARDRFLGEADEGVLEGENIGSLDGMGGIISDMG